MKVIQGHFAEARLYLRYCWGVLRPGGDLPVFGIPKQPEEFRVTSENYDLLIDEGRRQLDRQAVDLDRIRSRSATLLPITIAEIALLAASAQRAFGTTIGVIGWIACTVVVVLAAAGAVSVMAGRAVLGRTDTASLAERDGDLSPILAETYSMQVGYGEETVRTLLTVVRDAAFLAVLAAVGYGLMWALVLGRGA